MHRVLEAIRAKQDAFAKHPLFAFVCDARLAPRHRLQVVPALSHFVLTFADLYRLVLRDEPTSDPYQAIVNAHTYEDGGHWKWFLADLDKLGENAPVPFADALRFLWSEETARLRMLSYNVCRLGLGADPLHKLVVVQCIEATGKVTLEAIAPVGRAFARETGKNLVYFGPHHFETESQHTLEEGEVHRAIESTPLSDELARDLVELAGKIFALFEAGADDLLECAKRGASASQPRQIAAAPRA